MYVLPLLLREEMLKCRIYGACFHEKYPGYEGSLPHLKRTGRSNFIGMTTGFGLLTVTGNEHKQMRKVMNPAFSISNLVARACHSATSITPTPPLLMTNPK